MANQVQPVDIALIGFGLPADSSPLISRTDLLTLLLRALPPCVQRSQLDENLFHVAMLVSMRTRADQAKTSKMQVTATGQATWAIHARSRIGHRTTRHYKSQQQ